MISDNDLGRHQRGAVYNLKASATGAGRKSPQHIREKQPGAGRGVLVRVDQVKASRPLSPVIHVRAYRRASWVTGEGVARKRKLIENKGLPRMHGWRFITLTIDPERFENPLEAYQFGSDHMRRFLYAARKAGLWTNKSKWAWKLEFQANGWPHWHLLVERRKRMTSEDFRTIGRLWGLGRTNVEMVNERDFRYTFKYAFKAVQVAEADEFSDAPQFAPDWFLDFVGSRKVVIEGVEVEKPVTLARVRFWQTSRGFYTKRNRPRGKVKEPVSSIVPRSAREVLDQQSRTVLVIARKACGSYKASKVVTITCNLEQFWNLSAFDIVGGHGVGLAPYSFVIPTHRIKTNKIDQWTMQQLISQNRLQLPQAVRLQSRGETLRTS